jgi:hypothetical protein
LKSAEAPSSAEQANVACPILSNFGLSKFGSLSGGMG